jgi:uncharacterized protein YbjT (DUF2867 family)
MKILVTNPTGRIGRRILPELLAPEFFVRVIVRNPLWLPTETREQVDLVQGSTDDPATLRRALDGVEAMFFCVPGESLHERKVDQHYERFACAAWRAVRDARTPKVVTISAGGKGRACQVGPIAGLHAMEEILNESGAAIRHLRCGFFMENFLSQAWSIRDLGLISYPMPGNVALPLVAVTDVADLALRWLVRRDWEGIQSVGVDGPEYLSFNQAAAALERTLELPVRYQEASPNQYIASLMETGASAEFARSRVEMFSEFALGIFSAEQRTTESTTRTKLTRWAQKELLPAVRSGEPEVGARDREVHFCNRVRTESEAYRPRRNRENVGLCNMSRNAKRYGLFVTRPKQL